MLQNDLAISGAFALGQSGLASYLVSGSASGGGLQGVVKDRSGGTVLSKSYTGGPRAVAHAFADDIVETLTGHPGIAKSRIAFVSTRTGRKEIYTADYDGANVRQLTSDGVISVAPAISADGSKVAYTGYQSGYADIYLIDLASGRRERIIKFPGTNSGAAFSPDGGASPARSARTAIPNSTSSAQTAPARAGSPARAASSPRPPGRRTVMRSFIHRTRAAARVCFAFPPTAAPARL